MPIIGMRPRRPFRRRAPLNLTLPLPAAPLPDDAAQCCSCWASTGAATRARITTKDAQICRWSMRMPFQS